MSSKNYVGEGKTLEEALHKAMRKAERSIRVPDGECHWRVKDIQGTIGGFSSRIVIKVTIEASE